jgi:hypothetical protein
MIHSEAEHHWANFHLLAANERRWQASFSVSRRFLSEPSAHISILGSKSIEPSAQLPPPGNCAQSSNENPGLRAMVSNIERKFFVMNVRLDFHSQMHCIRLFYWKSGKM